MKIRELLDTINYEEFIGDDSAIIEKIVPFNKANEDDKVLMWINEKNAEKIGGVKRGTIIVPAFAKEDANIDCNYIIVKNPRSAFRSVLQNWFAEKRKIGISHSSVISETAVLGKNIFVGENVVIEQNCIIGDECSIGHNTVIKSNTTIGENVFIGSNCTIGGVGFGYEKNEMGEYELIPHIGGVVIANGVDIGNNTCIDRGVINNTYIGENVKIDNLVHIAHGVQIDKNSLIIANAMVGGSTTIGKNVWVAPSASLINKIRIDDNAIIGMGAVVVKNVDKEKVIVGNPGKPLEKR